MVPSTILIQDSFVSTGAARIIPLVSDVDTMEVWNFTNAGATGDDSFYFKWQRGMANGTGIRQFKSGGGNTTNTTTMAAPTGFTLVDTTTDPKGPPIAVTSTTNAAQPVVATGNTADLIAGDAVFLFGIANVPNLGGWPYTIDTVVANTSFRIKNALANAPGAVGAAGFYQKIQFGAYWQPSRVFIANVSQAAQAVVTVNVDIDGNVVVGQKMRFAIEPEWGMVELNGRDATVVAVNANNTQFTVDIDTSTFTAFQFPLVAAAANTRAHAWAYAETAASPYENLLDDSLRNVGVRGIRLAGGADSPGGGNGDTMFFTAYKSANL